MMRCRRLALSRTTAALLLAAVSTRFRNHLLTHQVNSGRRAVRPRRPGPNKAWESALDFRAHRRPFGEVSAPDVLEVGSVVAHCVQRVILSSPAAFVGTIGFGFLSGPTPMQPGAE